MNRLFYTIAAVFVAVVVLGPILAPYDPISSDLSIRLQGPNLGHWLGTDAHGRDILSQILFGARLSLVISVSVVLICLFTGVWVGFAAGYFGGLCEKVFLLVSDVFQAFPGILLAIAVAAFIPASVGNLILILSFVGWVSYARVVRAQVLEIKKREFVVAAESLGVSTPKLLIKHILPNMAGPLVVQASFGLAGVILAESTLSFLGLGLPAQTPSLGKLLDSGVGLLLIAPYVSLFPGFVILCFVLGFNLLGDDLRKRWVV